MRSHWVPNDVKYCPALPSRRLPRSLHAVSTSNRCCQTNANHSQWAAKRQNLC